MAKRADKAVIQATFSDWKMIKTRKVLALTFEVPLEHTEQVISALGTPMPDKETWVAIALMGSEPGKLKGGPLAQQAGIICGQKSFHEWIMSLGIPEYASVDAESATKFVRRHCRVETRAHLDHDEDAAKSFREMKTDYEIWLKQ